MGKKNPKIANPKTPTKPKKPIEADTSTAGQTSPEREAKKSEKSKLKTEQTKVQSQTSTEQQQQQGEKEQQEQKKIKLVAVCEVLNKSLLEKFDKTWDKSWGFVEGAADSSGDNKNLPKGAKREKDDGQFRQYLGLKKDIETDAEKIKAADKKVHPEFGRMITFKAKVEWEDSGCKDSIAGKKIYWGYEREYNTAKKKKEDREPDENELLIGLSGPDKPQDGFSKTVQWFGPSPVDEHGWTSTVVFQVSQIEGDKFKIYAQADVDDSGKPGGLKKKTDFYEVSTAFEIEELCEVRTKNQLLTYYKKKGKESETPECVCIEGATEKSTDTENMPSIGKRETREGEDYFRQFINLKNHIDDYFHPEYGRMIQFKCKIVWKNDKYKNLPLKDHNIYWGYEYKYEDRPKASNTIKATFKSSTSADVEKELVFDKTLKGDEVERFEGLTGPVLFDNETADSNDKENIKQWFGPVKTDKNGWSEAGNFILSQYGGDQFKIHAKADIDTSGKPSGYLNETKWFQVWRKAWYQLTRPKGFQPPDLTRFQNAYKDVYAEIIQSPYKPEEIFESLEHFNIKYKKSDYTFQNKDKNTSFFILCRAYSGTVLKEDDFTFHTTPKEPVKTNMIFSDHILTPKPISKTIPEYKKSKLAYSFKEFNRKFKAFALNPPLHKNKQLVRKCEWTMIRPEAKGFFAKLFKKKTTISKEANIKVTENGIEFSIAQRNIKGECFKKDGTLKDNYKLSFSFQVNAYYSRVNGVNYGITSIFRKRYDLAEDKRETQMLGTTVHETGHAFYQTPGPGQQPASLPDHPMHWAFSGGHCYIGATSTSETGNNSTKNSGGKCAMATCSNKKIVGFCRICKPFVKLQKMDSTR